MDKVEFKLISPKKLIIFGARNSGKSTFTKYFYKYENMDREINSINKENGKF